ncbi:hypothetical protein N4G41_00145 [Kosakonia sacchari]|uniref:hypothetical protein n=1 Tax=Kosakonia sacchari TaxID=1158459 RepID=UPI002ACD52BB|nr:hypothetical protein [Kosakonia sacchari]MDZ7320048.1 hypothetical protein [Kosakonia sacchari]
MKSMAWIFSIILSIVLMHSYTERHKVLFTCTGLYNSEIQIAGHKIKNNSNIAVSVSKSRAAYVNIEGIIDYDHNIYHINREVHFRYEIANKKAGIVRIFPIEHFVNTSDTISTAYTQGLESSLLGEEKKGKLIRLWKLSDSVLLIGNTFSPVFSCTMINSEAL